MHDCVGVKIVMDTPDYCLWFYVWVWRRYFTIVSAEAIRSEHTFRPSVTVVAAAFGPDWRADESVAETVVQDPPVAPFIIESLFQQFQNNLLPCSEGSRIR